MSDDLAVFLNEGSGSFGTPSFLTLATDSTADPSSVICSDIDGDLDTDLVTAFIDGVTLFENDCGQAIPAVSEWALIGMSLPMLTADTLALRRSRGDAIR